MAMALSLAGLEAEGISIRNPSCVNKSFPNFFATLESLSRS
jgi:3-phosphoshikimate 1-carboxyvinyltransferase